MLVVCARCYYSIGCARRSNSLALVYSPTTVICNVRYTELANQLTVTVTFAVRSNARVTINSTVVEAGFILVKLQPKRSNSRRLPRRYGYEANGLPANTVCHAL